MTALQTVAKTFRKREVIKPGSSDTLELLITVMMATQGCDTLNRWERQKGGGGGGVMCAKKLWLLHISPEKWPGEKG